MKKYRILLFLTLAIVLLLATTQAFASPASPQNGKNTPGPNTPGAKATEKANDKATKQANNPHGKHENYKGIVSAVDSTSITLTLRDGSSVTVGLSADTRMKFPGPKNSTPGSIQSGMRAIVQAIRERVDTINASDSDLVANLRRGDIVVLRSGAFAGYEAIFDARLPGQDRVRVLLQLLENQQFRMIVPAGQISHVIQP